MVMTPVEVITVADVLEDLGSNYLITDTTSPSTANVQQWIDDTTLEVRAIVESNGGAWPTDFTTIAAGFLRRTILEGSRWLTMRGVFALSGATASAGELEQANKAYAARLAQIPMIVKGINWETPSATIGSSSPGVGYPEFQPAYSASFLEAVEYRYFRDRYYNYRTRFDYRW